MNKKQTYNLARTLTLGPLFCLAACTVGPDFTPPDLSSVMQDEWQLKAGETERFSQIRQPESAWWRQFSDAELASLIGRLHESSLPLAKARERIVEVNARQGVIEADRRLQLAAALGYTHVYTGDDVVSRQAIPPGKNLDIYSTGLIAGWELDLWGRTARLLEAGEQDIRMSYADYHGMLVSLAAELSLAYFEVRTLEARLINVRENLALQQRTRELAQSRYDAGTGSALEVTRADRLISSTRAYLPEFERNLAVAKNRIRVLLGVPPREQVLSSGPMPAVPELIGVGLPVDLATRRPDIKRALYHYHAAVARIGAAQAEKYPAISLSGTVMLSTDSLAGLFDGDALMYTLGSDLRFPIFTGKRIEATVAVRESQAEQARYDLEQQIVEALSEVENAATGVIRTQQKVRELEQAELFASRSVDLADELYQVGLGDLYQVLDNQQHLIIIQERLLLARQQALSEVVALYRALGGGWEQASSEDTRVQP
jgi:NodT family efflux transporter outer membrane factor (OMF) lipoprotein